MRKSIRLAIEEIHEIRRTIFNKYNRDTQAFGKFLANRQNARKKAGVKRIKVTV